MELILQNKQVQQLNPRMEMSLSILGLTEIDLHEYLNQYAENNPLLEIELPEDINLKKAELEKRINFATGAGDYAGASYPSRDDDSDAYNTDIRDDADSMYAYLIRQLGEMKLGDKLAKCIRYIFTFLDENGFLKFDMPKTACKQFDTKLIMNAISIIQQRFEPAGIGARSLQECLILQLRRKGQLTNIRKRIINEFLYDMIRGKESAIAKKLDISPKKLSEEYAVIQNLNPKPCASIGMGEQPTYIKPDIIIRTLDEDGFDIDLCAKLPRVTVGKYYIDMLRQTDSRETIDYISKQVSNAKWLMSCLIKRQDTLLKVARALTELQREFFLHGLEFLTPMRLADVAEKIEMHESTVSRAVGGKYIECDHGLMPIKKLFQGTKGNNKGNCSDVVKIAIGKLIDEEDGKKPLSDQKISELLLKQGTNASRRTVAKYREQMGILSSNFRYKL